MEHYYQTVGEDWFTFPELYKQMVNKYDNAHFVEVGSWKGRSACYMGVEIINSGKNIILDCVDTFEYVDSQSDIKYHEYNDIYKQFIENIEPVSSVVKAVKEISHIASYKYLDNSLDFIFIDAAHDYVNVRRDIISWYRKVKKGGVIAGHDYHTAEGVKRAVDEILGMEIVTSENCWIYYVN